MRRALKILGVLVGGLVVVILLLLAPVGYVEAFCRADPQAQAYTPLIASDEFRRQEANSYLTYPEWHIVYAYEGLANVMKTGDEHDFGYASSVAGFWSSFCALNREAGRHGGADGNTRGTIHVIGVSFTLEMALKAAYEETIGRVFALLRGPQKTPQDIYAAGVAADYGRFLHQTPWYKYDFDAANRGLWAEPVNSLRGWERRLALGGEWKAKSAYAGVIADAVQATGEAKLVIRSVVRGVPAERLAGMGDVTVLSESADGVLVETPRYRAFTLILQKIADAGGTVAEIAGNDDIMVSAVTDRSAASLASSSLAHATLISDIPRDGFLGRRLLLNAKVADLATLFSEMRSAGIALEHVYDY